MEGYNTNKSKTSEKETIDNSKQISNKETEEKFQNKSKLVITSIEESKPTIKINNNFNTINNIKNLNVNNKKNNDSSTTITDYKDKSYLNINEE